MYFFSSDINYQRHFIAMVMKTYNYSLVKAALHKYAGLQNESVLMPEFSLKIGFNL